MARCLTDAPEAEYYLTQGIRRLTRINTIDPDTRRHDRCYPVEPLEPLNPSCSSIPSCMPWKWGAGTSIDEEAARLREYLQRGGFLMVDDFHGSEQWEGFMESFRRVFPDREVRGHSRTTTRCSTCSTT